MIYNWYESLQKRYIEGTDYTFENNVPRLYENLQWISGPKPTIEEFSSMAGEDTATAMLNQVRNQRNTKLQGTDWRFRSDLTPSQEWVDYCQALRDLPADPSNWSWNANGDLTINWPAEPA